MTTDDLMANHEAISLRYREQTQATAELVLEALDKYGLGDVVRWHLGGNNPVADLLHNTGGGAQPSRLERKPEPSKRAPARDQSKRRRNYPQDWIAKVIAPALRHPPKSKARSSAIWQIHKADHDLHGETVRVAASSLYRWVERAELKAAEKKETNRRERKQPHEAAKRKNATRKAKIQKPAKTSPLLGHPLELVEGEAVRKTDCEAYNTCLDHAATYGWRDWTCISCDGAGKRKAKGRGKWQ